MSLTIPEIPITATSILATDLFEVSSGGVSKKIGWSAVLASPNAWAAKQTFNNFNVLSGSSGGVATITGTGAGDMSINWQGVQGTSGDFRVGTSILYPLVLQGGIANFPSAIEHVVVGEGNNGTGDPGSPVPYTRIEYGWQSANPGWYSFHEEAGHMPDTIPAPGGLNAKPLSFGIADHTNTQYNHHVMGSSTDGPLVDNFTSIGGGITPLSGNRTFVMGAWFFGIRPLGSAVPGGLPISYLYDGSEQAYLQPPVPTATGHHDSHQIVWAGTWNAGGGATDYHVMDWKFVVNVTDNAGTNTFKLQSRKDLAGGGFTDRIVFDERGMALPSTNGAPSWTPQSIAGFGWIVPDPTNNKLWMYNGTAWKSVTLS